MIFEKKIVEMYRKMMFNRCDDNGVAYYFSSDDFEGLHKVPFAFKSQMGHTLQGYFYAYDNPIKDRVVVFEHGMGGGHRSYMREIETIAKKGYLVFAYDHTGCMESGGENTNGFAQSLNDLDCCLKALKADDQIGKMAISVIGHSWGAFSTMNIAAYHPDVKHIVAMSGFVSVERMVKQNFSGLLKPYAKVIFDLEKRSNPKYAIMDAVETLAGRDVKALIIHSDDDPLVKTAQHFEVMQNELKARKNTTFWLMNGKFHNPNYTEKSVVYKDAYVATLNEKIKKKELETEAQKKAFVDAYDWWAMTEQDMDVWNRIFEFIEK